MAFSSFTASAPNNARLLCAVEGFLEEKSLGGLLGGGAVYALIKFLELFCIHESRLPANFT